MRRDLKWRESVGADSFMPTFVSESMPLDVYVICVHMLRVVLCSSPSVYVCQIGGILGGMFVFISMYLKPHLCFRGRFDYLA